MRHSHILRAHTPRRIPTQFRSRSLAEIELAAQCYGSWTETRFDPETGEYRLYIVG